MAQNNFYKVTTQVGQSSSQQDLIYVYTQSHITHIHINTFLCPLTSRPDHMLITANSQTDTEKDAREVWWWPGQLHSMGIAQYGATATVPHKSFCEQ